jgi:hypothetical protein
VMSPEIFDSTSGATLVFLGNASTATPPANSPEPVH